MNQRYQPVLPITGNGIDLEHASHPVSCPGETQRSSLRQAVNLSPPPPPPPGGAPVFAWRSGFSDGHDEIGDRQRSQKDSQLAFNMNVMIRRVATNINL